MANFMISFRNAEKDEFRGLGKTLQFEKKKSYKNSNLQALLSVKYFENGKVLVILLCFA